MYAMFKKTLLLISLIMSTNISAETSNIQKGLIEMEYHWQQLINETDKNKQSIMIKEHRKMMNNLQSSTTGHMHGGNHHHSNDAMHAIDLHMNMIDMMGE